MLEPGEPLWERRVKEAAEAAGILGVHRLEFLGYADSGIASAPTNCAPGSFSRADVEEAAGRLTAILVEERAEVLTVYDELGVTGHPDHIQVHRVGVRAAALAATPRVYEVTLSRTQVRRLVRHAARLGLGEPPADSDIGRLGTPDELITTVVDVRDYLSVKRKAMAAHASQIAERSFFLAMPARAFAEVWGTEWFIRRGARPGVTETNLFTF